MVCRLVAGRRGALQWALGAEQPTYAIWCQAVNLSYTAPARIPDPRQVAPSTSRLVTLLGSKTVVPTPLIRFCLHHFTGARWVLGPDISFQRSECAASQGTGRHQVHVAWCCATAPRCE